MGTVIIAYLLGWAAVTAYVIRLAVQGNRLTHRLEEVRSLLEQGRDQSPFHSDAA